MLTNEKIEVKCDECNVSFLRLKKEYVRSQKLGRKSFCSVKCSGKKNGSANLGDCRGNLKHLKRGKERDAYSAFRYFHKLIRQRHKEKNFTKTDITLEFLKELWEEQNALCPITGWEMVLPETTRGFETIINPRKASLDRIQPHKPYMKGNIRYVSFMANMCKHEFSDAEVFIFAEAVTKKRNR